MTKTTASGTKAAAKQASAKSAAPAKTAAPAARKAAPAKSASRNATESAQATASSAEADVKSRTVATAKPPAKKPSSTPNDMPAATTKVDTKLASAWKSKAGRELSEAELLAMPDAEYMSDKQLEFFRARLEAQKEDLLSNAGETTEHLREDTSIVPDPADRATIEEEHALELRTRDRERKLLKKISQALVRIDNGEYGFCDETGEPIGLGRLLARPTATLSLEAQQRRELKQKMFGD